MHYGAFGKMYDRNPIEWSLNEDRQKHFNYGYSDWSWFRNGDIVNGKFFGANGAGTGDLYALNAEKDTMTAFTHFWNCWNKTILDKFKIIEIMRSWKPKRLFGTPSDDEGYSDDE